MSAHQADTCGWCGSVLAGHVEQSPFGWMCADVAACNSRYLSRKAQAAHAAAQS